MSLVDMANGSVVTEHELARGSLNFMSGELTHWSGCSSCLKSTTEHSQRHRAARLAKPLMSP